MRIPDFAGLYPTSKLSSAARPRVGLTYGPVAIFSDSVGTVPDAVKPLVDHFDQNRDAYLSGSYKEEQPVEDADGRQLTADGPGGGR